MDIDPARQFSSPYIGMSNNPINGVDPDGKWFWEKSYIRQARQAARHTGGQLILDKDIGLASVDISGTSYAQPMGGHLLQFKDGQYNYELMNSIGMDFSDVHLSMVSGWDYVKWMAEMGDQYARGEGKYDRKGQAPDWAKAFAGLNAPVSVGDGIRVWVTGKNIYGENATSTFDKIQAQLA